MREKMKRMLVVMMATMVLVMTSIMPANAMEVQPRLPACPNCSGGAMVTSYTSYSSWVKTGETRGCTHYAYGTDMKWKRSRTKTTKCNKCSYGYSTTEYQYKWVCHGYT